MELALMIMMAQAGQTLHGLQAAIRLFGY